jgi:hypothetical protein
MPHEISQECGRVYTLMVARTLESKGLLQRTNDSNLMHGCSGSRWNMCLLILINGSQMARSICDEISDIELVTRRRKALIMHVSDSQTDKRWRLSLKGVWQSLRVSEM